jgi:hypothetical protein
MQAPKKYSLKTTEEIVEEEYYDEEEPSVQSMDTNLELKRLQELVENNRNIPDVIILKD